MIFSPRKFHHFLKTSKGGAAIIFGLFVLPMLGSVGLALDIGRAHLLKSRLGYALDAAGLAAASSYGSEAELEERLNAFVQANFPATSAGEVTSVTATFNGNFVTLEATAKVETAVMRVFGKDEVEVRVTNEVLRETKGVEVALVLDTTGSMWSNNNYIALREAATLFLNELYGDDDDHEKIRVSVVPFSASVNVGAEAVSIVNSISGVSYSNSDPVQWKGCVFERPYPHDIRDSSVAVGGRWDMYYWTSTKDNYWRRWDYAYGYQYKNRQRNPNAGCPQPIMPLSTDRDALLAKVQGLYPWSRGGTMGPIGMAWGWRTLSPEAPFTEGSAYDDPEWRKVIIMMTDGDNMYSSPSYVYYPDRERNPYSSDMTGYRRLSDRAMGTTYWSTAKERINQRLEEGCTLVKEAGITIYTITFTSGINAATKDYYRRCASDSTKYTDAPTQADLRRTFQTIGGELSNLRLTQ